MDRKYIAAICLVTIAPLASCANLSSSVVRADDYPNATTTPPAGRNPPANLAGTLTKPLADYSGDEFNALVSATAKGGGHTRPRNCKHFVNCFLGGGKTDVTITSTADAMWLTTSNAGANGTIAAVVSGIHHDTDSYPFLKNDTYAFIVYPATAPNNPTWTLEQIEKTGGSYTITPVANGVFKECTPGKALYWTSSSADFEECGVVPHPTPVAKMDVLGFGAFKAVLGNLALIFGGDTSAWITCETGCCTMAAE